MNKYRVAFIPLLIILALHSSVLAAEYIVLGDCRPGQDNEEFQLTEKIIHDAIEYVLSNTAPPADLQGIILTGDYVSSGKDAADWQKFRSSFISAFDYPVYPCPGNHDTEAINLLYSSWNYYETFMVPRWYSVDLGPLHLIVLDSNIAKFNVFLPQLYLLDSMQYNWLKQDLISNAGKFTVALWHEPAYSSHPDEDKGHGSNLAMRRQYVPLLEKYNADLVLCGHNHWYERTVPIRWGTRDSAGITYVTTGGGGASLYPAAEKQKNKLHDWKGKLLSAVNVSSYHFCVLSVSDSGISFRAIRYDTHELLDSFEISK